MTNSLLNSFVEIFGTATDTHIYFAPGRINLIGEHIDYNGGFVFPCALTMGTYAVVKPRPDRKLRFYSINFKDCGIIEASLDSLDYAPSHHWANYPKGILWTLQNKGYALPHGMDILYYGNIPNGAGLSSSASIEVLTAYIAKHIYNLNFDMQEAALMCQHSENNYNGVNCGIMDQFAIAMGKRNHAIHLDTATLRYKYVPVNLGKYKLIIMFTNKQRKLGESRYNKRRSECEAALALLQSATDINTLCDLSVGDFKKHSHLINDTTLLKRARHAVYENTRTTEAVTVLEQGDIIHFGELMTASHISLRDDYEVTGIELDTLASAALKHPGAAGARMTGAGFGGCAIALVEQAHIKDFITNTGKEYLKTVGYEAGFYVAEIGDGPRQIV